MHKDIFNFKLRGGPKCIYRLCNEQHKEKMCNLCETCKAVKNTNGITITVVSLKTVSLLSLICALSIHLQAHTHTYT